MVITDLLYSVSMKALRTIAPMGEDLVMASTAALMTAVTTSLFRASEMLRRQVASFMMTLVHFGHKCGHNTHTVHTNVKSWTILDRC